MLLMCNLLPKEEFIQMTTNIMVNYSNKVVTFKISCWYQFANTKPATEETNTKYQHRMQTMIQKLYKLYTCLYIFN